MRTFRFVAAILVFALTGCAASSYRIGKEADTAKISDLVERFRLAILRKDKDSYMGLFFSRDAQEIGWQAVVDDDLLLKIQKDRPQAIKARRRSDNTFVTLIDSVVASKVDEEELISNVAIDTDGEIASVSFDYVYKSAGVVKNWGKEQWQLVRTESGWKIFSAVYTIRLPSQ